MSAPDLTRAIGWRGYQLNTVTESQDGGRAVLVGCRVEMLDVSAVELRQFTEPNALVNGLDYGGVWLGARQISMRGVVMDKTRGEAYDRLNALIPLGLPERSTFGLYALTYYTLGGAGGTQTQKSVMCRPNGVRYPIDTEMVGQGFSSLDSEPLAIPWSLTFIAMNPAIS